MPELPSMVGALYVSAVLEDNIEENNSLYELN
jgi:hypothetical protein